jgi:heat shock protein HslJ
LINRNGTYGIEGETVVLDKSDSGMKYFVLYPQGLLMRDINRKVITGALSERYILSRKAPHRDTTQKTDALMRMKQKLAEAVGFYALGNEPSWSLDIDFDKGMRFQSLTELAELNTPPGAEARAQDADGTSYCAQTEAGMLIVTIMKGPCTDTMSGETFPLKVRVDAKYTADTDYKQFEGCGRYVVDYRLNDIWVLTRFNAEPVDAEDFVKGLPVIEFHLNENKIFGSTGCNRIRGKFEAKGKRITFGKSATTLMACPNMEFEKNFLSAITDKTLTYSVDEGRLTLTDGNQIVLEFKKGD